MFEEGGEDSGLRSEILPAEGRAGGEARAADHRGERVADLPVGESDARDVGLERAEDAAVGTERDDFQEQRFSVPPFD